MARKPASPFVVSGDGLRHRQRADGSWRLWWEPTARQRKLGAKPVELDADRPGHAQAEARRLAKAWSGPAAPAAPFQPRGRSVNDLIHAYKRDRLYLKLAASTRVSYDSDMSTIAAKWGAQPVVLLDKPVMRTWYESLLAAKGPHRAKALVTMTGILMGFAEVLGWRPEGSNPCSQLRMETPAPRQRRATRAEIAALLDAARRLKSWDMLAAIGLELVAGQRVNDVMLARAADFARIPLEDALTGQRRQVWVWSFRQTKRGKRVDVPLHAAVAPVVRMLLARARRQGNETLLVNPATGRPWTKRPMWQAWDKVRSLAAVACPSVADLDRRDLRRTFGVMARDGGATADDVQDVLGNTAAQDPLLRETYMPAQIATSLRAVEAISLAGGKPGEKRKRA